MKPALTWLPALLLFLVSFPSCTNPNRPACSSDNLLPFREKDKWGFINTSGQVCISAKFDHADYFHDGLAEVQINGKYGVIDSIGNFVIQPQYTGMGTIEKDNIIVSSSGKWGIIDLSGHSLAAERFDQLRYEEKNDLFVFQKGDSFGIIEKNGTLRFIAACRLPEEFRENRMVITINNKSGYLSPEGRLIIQPKFDWAGGFSNGKAFCREGNTILVIDTTGKTAEKIQLPEEPTFQQIAPSLLAFLTGSHWSVINLEGQQVSAGFTRFGRYANGYIPVRRDSLWGFIDSAGRLVIEPTYESAGSYSEGLFSVRKNVMQGWGFIDRNGKWIIPPHYASVTYFSEGIVFARESSAGTEWICLDKSGKRISDLRFDHSSVFHHEIAQVELLGRMAYLGKNGKIIWQERIN